jgi:hypothetical protein
MANFDPTQFGATPVTPTSGSAPASSDAPSFNPAQFGAIPINSDTSTNSMAGATPPAKNAGFFQPTVDRAKQFVNNDQQSLADFATQKASQGIFGIGAAAPATADDLTSGVIGAPTGDSQNWGVFGGFKIPTKVAANVFTDVPNLIADVAGFSWQTFAHPVDTIKNIASDPVGFAEGMLGDAVTQPLEGLATAVKDLVQGKGGEKAGADAVAGFQKGMIAFIDRPITSVIQLQLAKGLATDPIGTTKEVVKSSIDNATKPWQAAYNFIKDPKQAVTDAANAIQNKWDAIKNIPTFFTKDGMTKIAQGMGNQILQHVQNNLKINDLQTKLQSLDTNSSEYANTQDQINMAQQKVDNARTSITGLVSAIANKTGEIFSRGGYKNTTDFTTDANGVVDQMYKSKNYVGALNPGGQAVNVSDVSPLTDYLKTQGDKLEAQGNPDAKTFQNAASELQLRHDITQAGGEQGYIEQQVQQKMQEANIDPTQNPGKAQLAEAQFKQEATDELQQKIATKPAFFTRPLTADDLYSYVNNLGEKVSSNFGSKLIADQNTDGSTAKSITLDVIKPDLAKVDPNAPANLDNENTKFSALKNIWDGWKDKTFNNVKGMVDFITSDKNWSDFQNFPQEMISKFQNTLASYITDSARNPDGSINFNKLSSMTQQYSPYLTSNHTGPLSELSYANSLPENVASTPQISDDLKNVMQAKGELSQNEQELTEAQSKAEALKANMDVVGTTPEEIATNLKGIQTMDDLNNFMKASNVSDPKVLGDLITGTLYDQMQQQFGTNKGVNFQQLTKLVEQTRNIGNDSPLGQQLKDALFSPEDQKALETLETQSQKLSDMFDSKGITPGAKRLFHAAFSAAASVLGWHVTAIRSFFEAVKPNANGDTENTTPNELNLSKMGKQKTSSASTKQGIIPRAIGAIPKLTPAAEGLKNTSPIPQWFKDEASNRNFNGDINQAWDDFNNHVSGQNNGE